MAFKRTHGTPGLQMAFKRTHGTLFAETLFTGL